MNLCYYITSHGFGHATRSFAVIKELLDRGVKVTIRADLPDWLVYNSLKHKNLTYHSNFKTLKAYHDSYSLKFQSEPTMHHLNQYCANYETLIRTEIKLCKSRDFDLIISDMEPVPFEVAERLGIPSMAITNFTWFEIFEPVLSKDSGILNRFKHAYEKATLLFRFPFHFKMEYFKNIKDIPLLFRKLTRSRKEIRSIKEFANIENIVLVQFGGTSFNPFDKWTERLSKFFKHHPETKFLLLYSSKMNIPDSLQSQVIITEAEDTETQDYLAASDLVIGKVGYSTVAEVVGYRVPFYYCLREQWPENAPLIMGLEDYGISRRFSLSEIIEGSWIDTILEDIELKNKFPRKKIKTYGQDLVASYISKNFP